MLTSVGEREEQVDQPESETDCVTGCSRERLVKSALKSENSSFAGFIKHLLY